MINLNLGSNGQGLHYGKRNENGRKKLLLFIYLFFSIFMGWVGCFYFCNNLFFITGNAPLILKIFNKTHVILILIRKLLFFSYVLLFTILLLTFQNCICHLNFLSPTYFFHCYVNQE